MSSGIEEHQNRHKTGAILKREARPRPLEVIETDIKKLEAEILAMLKEVTA